MSTFFDPNMSRSPLDEIGNEMELPRSAWAKDYLLEGQRDRFSPPNIDEFQIDINPQPPINPLHHLFNEIAIQSKVHPLTAAQAQYLKELDNTIYQK